MVYGKIFTSESNQIAEAFAVKDGRYIYAGDRKGAEAFIEEGSTEVIDPAGKGLVMPSCGSGHAHYFAGRAMPMDGTAEGGAGFVDPIYPDSPFGIMEIAAAGVKSTIRGEPWRHDELLTCEQALTALTINCAKQMIIENERGSISVGKYADFLFVDKDVLSCLGG